MTCRENESWNADSDACTELDGLQTFNPHGIALHNRLHRVRAAWEGSFAGQAIRVRWSGEALAADAALDLHAVIGTTAFTVRLPAEALEALKLSHVELDAMPMLPGAMLLELSLLGLIEPLEALTGETVRITGYSSAATGLFAGDSVGMTLTVQWAGQSPLHVPLRLSHDAARLIATLLDQHASPARHALADLYTPLAVESGEAWLSLAELRSLRPGDVVMLDDWPDAQVRLVFDDRLSALALRDGRHLTLLQTLTAVTLTKEPCMSESLPGANPDAPIDSPLDATLDQLPLKLVCQVGSVELSLGELRELGEGSLLPLSSTSVDGVDLMVNGRRVGQGQLVRIGDGLGVRLLSLATA